ncbi:hypothetical protein [uncultured Aliiroseovarius sp.]|uniref:hypothetical protein n=1 Tax=uncultured Aliiroseovarius sp. TaxID=1658783 RepID=UPI0025939A65|nr:hypothetical protein [uncultured Aliiroseovarius sp.]
MMAALFESPTKYRHKTGRKLARNLRLDIAQFEPDLDASNVADRVQRDRKTLSRDFPPNAPYLFIDGVHYENVWN